MENSLSSNISQKALLNHSLPAKLQWLTFAENLVVYNVSAIIFLRFTVIFSINSHYKY